MFEKRAGFSVWLSAVFYGANQFHCVILKGAAFLFTKEGRPLRFLSL